MNRWVGLQATFPWLARGFIHAVAEAHADEFISDLQERGFAVATMHPRTPDAFHDGLAAALGFPDWYGKNWDAAHDCFRDLTPRHPFVLIWRGADEIAARDPKLLAEGASTLVREFEALGQRGIQAELVITGAGPTFRSPGSDKS